jgi:membrane fusion protein, multidrug efflux system
VPVAWQVIGVKSHLSARFPPQCLAFATRWREGDRMRPLTLMIGLLALSACGKGEEKRERPPPLVEVAAAAPHRFVDRYQAVGTAVANEQVTLTAPVTERIIRLNFADGGFVQRGQIIAELAQGQESAALASAGARAREAEQQLARLQTLKDRGFATKSSYDAQVAAAAAARADAAGVRASIGDRVIRAPFSGIASLRQISTGTVVSSGTPIATISDISVIKLDFTVPEAMLAQLAVGQPISAATAAFPAAPVRGTIRAIDPVLDPSTRAAKLRAVLPNPGGRIKPGMLLSVTIESRARDAIAVPELAIVNEGEARFVFTLGPDNSAKRVPVTTGGRDGGLVEVTSGLAPGTRIVTEGIVKLTDGMKVRLPGQGGPGGGKPGADKARMAGAR